MNFVCDFLVIQRFHPEWNVSDYVVQDKETPRSNKQCILVLLFCFILLYCAFIIWVVYGRSQRFLFKKYTSLIQCLKKKFMVFQVFRVIKFAIPSQLIDSRQYSPCACEAVLLEGNQFWGWLFSQASYDNLKTKTVNEHLSN